MKASSFKWLPNALSLSRGVLAIPLYGAAVQQEWLLGFWIFILALITDFLDGLAAKILHAESKLGGHIDRVSDFLLAAAGTLGLIVGAGILSLWILVLAVPASLFVGYAKILLPEDHKVRIITSTFSVILLFGVWILVVWGLAAQAYGWQWWYVPFTFALLAMAAIPKRHRFKEWFAWFSASHRSG